MSELTDYFVRHYTLVLNNYEEMYHSAISNVKRVTRDSDVTPSQYRAMSHDDRVKEFAGPIGESVLQLVEAWCFEALTDNDHPGTRLMTEIMIFNGSDLESALGETYLPEDSEADVYFIEGDDESEDDE
jgi:hypothetical protein